MTTPLDPRTWRPYVTPKQPQVYLAGPINGCTDAEAYDWREAVARVLPRTISPMARDYRGKETENLAEIVEGDKADIDRADVVLAFCPKPSVGTSMEILYAWERGKKVVVAVPDGVVVSPWLMYHAHLVVSSPEKAAQWIAAL